jgi:hypothetical protein
LLTLKKLIGVAVSESLYAPYWLCLIFAIKDSAFKSGTPFRRYVTWSNHIMALGLFNSITFLGIGSFDTQRFSWVAVSIQNLIPKWSIAAIRYLSCCLLILFSFEMNFYKKVKSSCTAKLFTSPTNLKESKLVVYKSLSQ